MRSSLATAVVLGAIVGGVAALALFRPRPPAGRPAAGRSTPAAPLTAASPLPRRPPPSGTPRSDALFDRNRAMPPDPDLASEYEAINDEYFSNILPRPSVRWESGLADLGSSIADGFTVQGLTDGRTILLNPAVERDAEERRRALCHEMVHVAVWIEDTEHGPIFQERLRQLSLRGAFKGIVATDQEKDAALMTLHRKRADLEAEERALAADRETVDRSSRVAVDAYNTRAERQRQGAADYNRLVEQYNLMIAYPDGLARERLTRRADGTRADLR